MGSRLVREYRWPGFEHAELDFTRGWETLFRQRAESGAWE